MKDTLRFVYAYQEEKRTNPENGKTFFSGSWIKIKECQSFKHAIDEATRLQAESVKNGTPVSYCVNS